MCICSKGFYNISGACLSPPANQTFSPGSMRFVCLEGYVNVSNKCYLPCKLNELIDPDGACSCQPSTYNISGVCTKPGLNQVYSKARNGFDCVEGYAMFAGICAQKPNCTDNAELSPKTFKCTCKGGYWNITGKCVKCPDNSVGGDAGGCVCQEGYRMSANLCQSLCTGGQIYAGRDCVCPSTLMAFIQNQCTLCPAGSLPTTPASTSCSCPVSQYPISGKCQPCQPFAQFNGTSCVCLPNYFLSSNQCITCWANSVYNGTDCSCKDGYYRSNSSSCALC